MCLKGQSPPAQEAILHPQQTIAPWTDHNIYVMNTDVAPEEDSCPIGWSFCETDDDKKQCLLPGTKFCCSQSIEKRVSCFCTEEYTGGSCQYMNYDESKSGGLTPNMLLILIFLFILFIIVTSLVVTFFVCRRRRWQQTQSRTRTSRAMTNGGSSLLKEQKPRSEA